MSAFHKMTSFGAFTFALVDTGVGQHDTDSPSWNLTAGLENGKRLLVVVFGCSDDEIDDDFSWPSTCLIGGVTADLDVGRTNSQFDQSIGTAIYSAIVPTGLTVSVSVTLSGFSGAMDSWAVVLYRGTGVGTGPISAHSGNIFIDVDTQEARVVVLASVDRNGPVSTNWEGGGNVTSVFTHGDIGFGFDDAPLGGMDDRYDLDGANGAFTAATFG